MSFEIKLYKQKNNFLITHWEYLGSYPTFDSALRETIQSDGKYRLETIWEDRLFDVDMIESIDRSTYWEGYLVSTHSEITTIAVSRAKLCNRYFSDSEKEEAKRQLTKFSQSKF